MADRVRDDPPEYDPDDAEAQHIAEEFADAAEEYDRAGEAWQEGWYPSGVSDPAGGT